MARANAYTLRPFKYKVLRKLAKKANLDAAKLNIMIAQHGVLYTKQQIEDMLDGKRDQCRGDILWAFCEIFGVQARAFYAEEIENAV